MQGWRRLQQSIPGAGENVAGSQAILSQPLLASFRKDWRVTRLDSSYWRGCKGSQAVIFRFYTPQLLCPFFFFFTIKKKQSVGMIAPTQNYLAALLLYSCPHYYPFTSPFSLFSRFLANLTVPHPTNWGTYNLCICLVCSAQAWRVCRAPSSTGA